MLSLEYCRVFRIYQFSRQKRNILETYLNLNIYPLSIEILSRYLCFLYFSNFNPQMDNEIHENVFTFSCYSRAVRSQY